LELIVAQKFSAHKLIHPKQGAIGWQAKKCPPGGGLEKGLPWCQWSVDSQRRLRWCKRNCQPSNHSL